MALGQMKARKRAPTAHDYVLSTLREAILSSQLPGGTRLVQSELAAELDVSITPVREALRDLANEGLVTSDAHRGSRVRTLDLAEVRELYELRILLEPLMVRRSVANATGEQLDRADRIRREMEATGEISVWSELNREFHSALNESDDHSRLTTILNGLRDGASAYVGLSLGANPERIAESNAEHAALVKLYRARDTEAATTLTVQHLHTTLSTIEQAHERGLL
jgi:DNA-binding GntR family transcriptional regulator